MAPASNMRSKPDFLCIGAPKAGTTWLYKKLAAHPQIWLPPVKELRYFNKRFPPPGVAYPPGRRMGLFGLFPNYPRPIIVQAFKHCVRPRHGMNLAWALRYLTGPGDFDWYASLFAPAAGRVAGDITPFYCALEPAAVAEIAQAFPHLRVIYLMRDPVARAWSNARMMTPLMTGRPIDELDEEDFLAFLARPSSHLEADYVKTLRAWEAAFPPQRMLIEFYDHISEAPQALLDRVSAHLGIAAHRLDDKALRERVNVGGRAAYGGMPPRVARALALRYRAQLDVLRQRFPEPAQRWYDGAMEVLAGEAQGGDADRRCAI